MSEQRELLNVLLAEKKSRIKGGIYNKMQVDFAYNSNHIEGSRLTHEQTRYIYETRTIGDAALVNDVFETANHFRCFDYILNTINQPLSEKIIKELHGILKAGVISDDDSAVVGDYKKYPNTVGEVDTVQPEQVADNIRLLIDNYNHRNSLDMYDIAQFHAEFEKIHPFYDGNGRIGRLLMLKLCLENNIVPFVITDEMKYFYYTGLKELQTEGKYIRLIDLFLEAQDDMKAVLDYFRIYYDKSDTTARELIAKRNI
ncbi:MAG: Fic family protein [Oscillospiraceae bacterium]|nr:Fic family protein [Oscillospiraceae bacterium]